jgi:glucuronokinase
VLGFWQLFNTTMALCLYGRTMFGDAALGKVNIDMVETARSVGAACKFTGSGGAVIAFCLDGEKQVKALEEACVKAGYIVEPVIPAPSYVLPMTS